MGSCSSRACFFISVENNTGNSSDPTPPQKNTLCTERRCEPLPVHGSGKLYVPFVEPFPNPVTTFHFAHVKCLEWMCHYLGSFAIEDFDNYLKCIVLYMHPGAAALPLGRANKSMSSDTRGLVNLLGRTHSLGQSCYCMVWWTEPRFGELIPKASPSLILCKENPLLAGGSKHWGLLGTWDPWLLLSRASPSPLLNIASHSALGSQVSMT